jgi:hypothetical protein
MKKLTGIFGLSLLLAAVTPAGARGQLGRNDNRSGDRVCVYENNYFQGWEECYRPGDEVSDLHSRGNKISSVQVYGNAILSIFDGRNFEGGSAQITSEVRDLTQVSAGGFANKLSWNDRIESFRVTTPNYRAPGPPRVFGRDDRDDNRRDNRPGRREPDSVCFYEDTDFRGRVECFDVGRDISDLGRSGGWSDRISSVRVVGNGRAAAYLDIGYRGERLIIDQDIPNLGALRLRSGRSWDNQISSFEVGAVGRAAGRR